LAITSGTSRSPRDGVAAKADFSNFLRNLAPDFLQYTGERPEMTPHDEGSKMPKTTKAKPKI
jgi:hypothetical protein